MRIGICDDEKYIRELIKNKIVNQYDDMDITLYQSGEELTSSDVHLDILFLDIRMSDKNGMEIARKLREKYKRLIIIFVTAFEKYVFQAFDVGAFNYIMKPIDDEKFNDILHKAVSACNTYSTLENEIQEKYILVNNGGLHIKVKIDEIMYAEVFNRKVVIHKNNEIIEYYGKMSELESIVGDNFFRPHRGYLVNFKYIIKYDSNTIYLENGKALMAKQNYPKFVKAYMKYNQKRR
ncbi:MAG: response regulator transcription factor [Erysipelotrichales bacterium]|nr:response regulator transcription factor [Erysipelotrichales bacterium]